MGSCLWIVHFTKLLYLLVYHRSVNIEKLWQDHFKLCQKIIISGSFLCASTDQGMWYLNKIILISIFTAFLPDCEVTTVRTSWQIALSDVHFGARHPHMPGSLWVITLVPAYSTPGKTPLLTSANEIAHEECGQPPVMWYTFLLI